MNWVITDNPTLVAIADWVRVIAAAVAVITIVMYLRLAWQRWKRLRAGETVRWPYVGTAALCLLLVVVASIAVQRRGMPVTWRAPFAWAGIGLSCAEAFRAMRINWAPPWRRHHPKGRRRA